MKLSLVLWLVTSSACANVHFVVVVLNIRVLAQCDRHYFNPNPLRIQGQPVSTYQVLGQSGLHGDPVSKN